MTSKPRLILAEGEPQRTGERKALHAAVTAFDKRQAEVRAIESALEIRAPFRLEGAAGRFRRSRSD